MYVHVRTITIIMILVLKLSNIFNFAHNFFFQWQGHLHLNYSTARPMSNTHCGNTGVLQSTVIDAEGCTSGILHNVLCILISVAVAVPYSPLMALHHKSLWGSSTKAMRSFFCIELTTVAIQDLMAKYRLVGLGLVQHTETTHGSLRTKSKWSDCWNFCSIHCC